MLARPHRLTKDFPSLYKKGRQVTSRNLRLIYSPNSQNTTRFGFVISKKHAAKIVQRNRIKRILRAAVAAAQKKVAPGFDVIIQGKPGVKNLKPAQVREELSELLTKSKITTWQTPSSAS